MAGGLLNVGASALNAAYTQLQVTGHNIANVNTPGYHRQDALLASTGGDLSGSGYVGRGVNVSTIQRSYDKFLEIELAGAQSSQAADQARAEQMARLDRMFADSDTGIGVSIDEFSAALADLVNRPNDTSARTVVYSRANDLAGRFRSMDGSLRQLSVQVDERIQDSAAQLNRLLSSVAELNNRIAQQGGSGHAPNDLLDQRDQLILDVNKIIKATSYINADGTASLFAAGGEALVVNTSAARLDASVDALDPTKSTLVLKTLGSDVPVNSATLGGGSLAGLLRFRDEDLASARARLGQLAGALASAYNTQQAMGVDSSGTTGQPMFSLGQPQISGASNNTGTAQLVATLADGSSLQASDYQLRYDGTAYRITRLSDGQQTSFPSLPATLDGLTLGVSSGAPAAGDQFLLRSASVFAASMTMTLSSPARLATGLAVSSQLAPGNAGDVSVNAMSVAAPGANLTQPVTITFTSATTYSVSGTGTGNPTGLTYVPGQTISYNGWSLTLRGTPQAGDSVSVGPNASPGTDNRNAKAMLDLANGAPVNGQSFSQSYAGLLADIGTRAQSANSSQSLSDQYLLDARASRDSVGGVNLDEEAARLLQFQQAYAAAARLISTAQSMFDALLNAAGR